MTDNTKLRSLFAVLAGFLVVMAAVSGAMAVSWDTSTADETSTTSGYDGAPTTVHWEHGNESAYEYFEIGNATASDYKLKVSDINTQEVYYVNDSENYPASDHATWNISQDELLDHIPTTDSQNDVVVTIVNKSSGEIVESNPITLAPSSQDTVVREVVGSAAANGNGTESTVSATGLDHYTPESLTSGLPSSLPFVSNDTANATSTFSSSASINSTNTTVVYEIYNNQTDSNLDSATANAEEGDWVKSVQIETVQTGPIPVFYESAPDAVSNSSMTYGTVGDYDADGETEVTIHPGDAYEGAGEITTKTYVNKELGYLEGLDQFGTDAITGFDGFNLGDLNPMG